MSAYSHKIKNIIISSFIYLCFSCSNGKIELRNRTSEIESCGEEVGYTKTGKLIYLINTTSDKKVTYTIKRTWNNKNTSTDKYTLNPGEEILLGCDEIFFQYDWSIINKAEYKIVGELIESNN